MCLYIYLDEGPNSNISTNLERKKATSELLSAKLLRKNKGNVSGASSSDLGGRRLLKRRLLNIIYFVTESNPRCSEALFGHRQVRIYFQWEYRTCNGSRFSCLSLFASFSFVFTHLCDSNFPPNATLVQLL